MRKNVLEIQNLDKNCILMQIQPKSNETSSKLLSFEDFIITLKNVTILNI